ncbi:MAG: 1-acyl-sn-glycerol-3-phosphate acyltransferase [Bacilli bacterium]|nr:1-acyl-sn-glycerol-3-phosphate acyltransferase [Bacilli bacterium]
MKEPLLYRILIPLNKLFIHIFKPTYINKSNIPKIGRIILAGNHTSKLDPLLLMSSTNRCIHFLAKIELFKGVKKFFFKNLGIIPVDRKRKNPEAINLANEYLLDNKVIGIFPESTINKTKETIMPFKYGAVSMAYKTDSVIVPFAITKKYKFLKKSVCIVFGEPYKVSGIVEKDNQILENKVIELIRRNQ